MPIDDQQPDYSSQMQQVAIAENGHVHIYRFTWRDATAVVTKIVADAQRADLHLSWMGAMLLGHQIGSKPLLTIGDHPPVPIHNLKIEPEGDAQ